MGEGRGLEEEAEGREEEDGKEEARKRLFQWIMSFDCDFTVIDHRFMSWTF